MINLRRYTSVSDRGAKSTMRILLLKPRLFVHYCLYHIPNLLLIIYDLLKPIVCVIDPQVNGLASLGTMNLNKRRMIFCTFIYSCAAIGLIGAGLGSKRWVVASARRTSNTTESVGQVNLGLFYGDKYLNIGYGLRTYSVDGKHNMMVYPHAASRILLCTTITIFVNYYPTNILYTQLHG